MKVYINDCSFQGQASNKDEAIDILFEVAQAFYKCKAICCQNKSAIHAEIKNKPIWGNVSIVDLLNQMQGYDANKKRAILEVLCKSPHYNSNKHVLPHFVQDESGKDISHTCFDSAAVSKCGAIVVSARKSQGFTEDSLLVNSSISGSRKIINVNSPNTADLLRWIYEPNIKHSAKPKDLGKFIISEMDLSPTEAQRVLTNGVYISRKVIAHNNGEWYCFPMHLKDRFHGYKITIKGNLKIHTEAQKILQALNYAPRGQIFYGYC